MTNRNESHSGPGPKNPLTKNHSKQVAQALHYGSKPSSKTGSKTGKPSGQKFHGNPFVALIKGGAKKPSKDKMDTRYGQKPSVGPKKAQGNTKPTSKSFSSGDSHRSPSTPSGHNVTKGSLHSAAATRHSGKSGGGGGTGKGSGGGSSGGGGGVNEKGLRAQASRLVQQDINAAQRALDHEAYTANKKGQYDINKLGALYDRSVGDLNHVFGEVNENTNLQNAKIDARFNSGKADLASIYNTLRGRLSSDSNANSGAAAAEQARLGIQDSGMGNFAADASNMQGVASTHAADAQANMNTQQTAAAQIGGMIASMGQSSLASNIGQAANTRNQGVNDVNEALRGDLADITSARREERLGKAAKVNDLWMQLSDRAFARRESNRNFALARQAQGFSQGMANSNFNLSVSKFNSDNLWKAAAQRQEDRRQAAIRRQQAAAVRASQSTGRPNTSGGRSLDSGV